MLENNKTLYFEGDDEMKLSIGLWGFGKTGRLVASEIIQDTNCTLNWVMKNASDYDGKYASHILGFQHDEGQLFSTQNVNLHQFFNDYPVDIIIDFSNSNGIHQYKQAASKGIRIVSAISNYEEKDMKVLEKASQKTAVLYSPNITLGINFVIEASKLLKSIVPHADIEIIEEHFKDKKDVSGTAIRMADTLNLDPRQHINSIRVGGIVGKHEVIFGLPNQTIRIVHETHNRAAFGQGAIYAAKWLMMKNIGMYTMEQALQINDSTLKEVAIH